MKLRGTSMVHRLSRNQHGPVQPASFGRRIAQLIGSDDSGSALVELAIALPVYLIVITGMVSTVMALYAYQQLAFATFTASEAIGSNRGQKTDPCALAATQLASGLPDWAQNSMTITVWITQNVAGTTTREQYGPFAGVSAATCSGDQSTPGNGTYAYNLAQGEPVTVRVSYVYSWFPIYSDAIKTGPLVAAESSIVR